VLERRGRLTMTIRQVVVGLSCSWHCSTHFVADFELHWRAFKDEIRVARFVCETTKR
jgi:hypothetical protein